MIPREQIMREADAWERENAAVGNKASYCTSPKAMLDKIGELERELIDARYYIRMLLAELRACERDLTVAEIWDIRRDDVVTQVNEANDAMDELPKDFMAPLTGDFGTMPR